MVALVLEKWDVTETLRKDLLRDAGAGAEETAEPLKKKGKFSTARSSPRTPQDGEQENTSNDFCDVPLGQSLEFGHNSMEQMAAVGNPSTLGNLGSRPKRLESSLVEGARMTMSDRERDRRSLQDLAKLAQMTPPTSSVARKDVTVEESSGDGDDSGIIDLALSAAKDPEAEVRAKTTPLASEGLFDALPNLPSAAAAVVPLADTPVAQTLRTAGAPGVPGPGREVPSKKSSTPLVLGALMAVTVAGVAGAVYIGQKPAMPAPPAPTQVAAVPTIAQPEAPRGETKPRAPAEPLLAAQPEPSPEPKAETSQAPVTPKAGVRAAGHTAGSKAATEAKPESGKGERAAPVAADPLAEEMRKAAGADGKPEPAKAQTSAPESIAGIPQRPSQGAVSGAVGAVLGSARECLGPEDGVSRASITFGSAGQVLSVALTGGAAGKPAEGCIKAALKGAKVQPFSDPSFVANVAIRQ